MSEVLIISASEPISQEFIYKHAKKLKSRLDFNCNRVNIFEFTNGLNWVLLLDNSEAAQIEHAQDEISLFAYLGYITRDPIDPRKILHEINRNSVTIPHTKPMGGNAVFLFADAQSITIWRSYPPIHSLWYAQSKGLSCISTSPLPASLTVGNVSFDETYIAKTLHSGYALDNTSPFCGVWSIPPDCYASLSTIKGLEIRSQQKPNLENADPRNELLRAVSAMNRFPVNRFHLSGGKDSRVIAAALSRTGAEGVHAVTRGNPEWDECIIGSQVAKVSGIPHKNENVEGHLTEDEIFAGLESSIRRRSGILSPSPSISFNSRVEPKALFRSITYGHGEFHQGGWRKKSRVTWSDFDSVMASRLTNPMVKPEINRSGVMSVSNWVSFMGIRKPSSALMESYPYFRVGRYLWSLNKYLSSYVRIFPLCDERYVLSIEQLPYSEIKKNRLISEIVSTLNPDLAKIAVYGGHLQLSRDRDLGTRRSPTRVSKGFRYNSKQSSTVLSDFILSSSLRRDLPDLVTYQARLYIEQMALGKSWGGATGRDQRNLVKLTWALATLISTKALDW